MGFSVTRDILLEQADVLYQFMNLFTDEAQRSRDYGTGESVSMSAVRVLCAILESPDIGGIELADRFYCTTSAISQNLNWLEDHGFIQRVKRYEKNKRKINCITEKGKALCEAHQLENVEMLSTAHDCLIQECSKDEILSFFKVMRLLSSMMASERTRRMQLKLEAQMECAADG